MGTPWSVVVEGDADVPVVAAILESCRQRLGPVFGLAGKARIDEHARGYCDAARHGRWLVLRDLDHDAGCAPELVARLTGTGSRGTLRIAVRSVESWLLADTERAASWLAVSVARVPVQVETLGDPKRTLIDLARRSRRREIRTDVVPVGTARIGPGYVDQVRRYCADGWRPEVAARRSPSLAACIAHLRRRASG